MKYRLATTVNPLKFSSNTTIIESWSHFASVDQIILIQPVCESDIISKAIKKIPLHIAKKLYLSTYEPIRCTRRGLPPAPDLYSLVITLQKLNPNTDAPILFLNSDLKITSSAFFSMLSHPTSMAEISYLYRYDITEAGTALGFYLHGIDAFLIRSPDVFRTPSDSLKNYFIGLPCWDHFLPLYTSSIASLNFLRSPALTHTVHPTSNPGHYSAQIPYLLADTIASSPLGKRLRPFLLLVFQAICQSNLALSILHKSIIFPRLRALGWRISRSRY